MQTKQQQLADLAMAIFMRDPPNDPKTLYETQEHSNVKLSGLGTASKGRGNKHEVCHDKIMVTVHSLQDTVSRLVESASQSGSDWYVLLLLANSRSSRLPLSGSVAALRQLLNLPSKIYHGDLMLPL